MPTARNSLHCITGVASAQILLILLAGAVPVMITGTPVQAGTRDQVMSKAFGCAEIGDARLWLDCYYGAAQSARVALGLQPAPAAQIALAQSPPAGSAPQAADIRDAVLSGAARCGEQKVDRKWLDCYYAAAQPMRAHLNLPPVPQQLQALNATDKIGPSHGSSRSTLADVPMTTYNFDRKGIFTITLSNGEVWRQLSGDTSFAHWKGEPGKYRVWVSRGLLGSYNLEVQDNPGMFKVHRVK